MVNANDSRNKTPIQTYIWNNVHLFYHSMTFKESFLLFVFSLSMQTWLCNLQYAIPQKDMSQVILYTHDNKYELF